MFNVTNNIKHRIKYNQHLVKLLNNNDLVKHGQIYSNMSRTLLGDLKNIDPHLNFT